MDLRRQGDLKLIYIMRLFGRIFCIAKFLSYIFVPSRLLISCRPNSTSEKIIQSQGGLKIDNKAGMNYYIINHIENI
jgi:hypothetical protein